MRRPFALILAAAILIPATPVLALPAAVRTTSILPLPLKLTAAQRGVYWYHAHTGIEPGHTLTLHGDGDWKLTAADSNKTFNDVQVNGSIDTTAATNVTFNDLKAYRVVNPEGGGGQVYNHCDLDGTNLPNNDAFDNQANDGTYSFCNIHGGFRGVQWTKFVNETDSWLHHFRELASGTHRCTTATNGMAAGGSATIQRDWLAAGTWGTELSGEVCMYGDFDQVHDVVLTGSVLMDSGSYQLYGGSCASKTFPVAENVVVMNNTFGPTHVTHPPGSQYGYAMCWALGNGDVWWGNTVRATGARVRPS